MTFNLNLTYSLETSQKLQCQEVTLREVSSQPSYTFWMSFTYLCITLKLIEVNGIIHACSKCSHSEKETLIFSFLCQFFCRRKEKMSWSWISWLIKRMLCGHRHYMSTLVMFSPFLQIQEYNLELCSWPWPHKGSRTAEIQPNVQNLSMYNIKHKTDVQKHIEKCPGAEISRVCKPYVLYLPMKYCKMPRKLFVTEWEEFYRDMALSWRESSETVLETRQLSQTLGEDALQSVQCAAEKRALVVRDGKQFVQQCFVHRTPKRRRGCTEWKTGSWPPVHCCKYWMKFIWLSVFTPGHSSTTLTSLSRIRRSLKAAGPSHVPHRF